MYQKVVQHYLARIVDLPINSCQSHTVDNKGIVYYILMSNIFPTFLYWFMFIYKSWVAFLQGLLSINPSGRVNRGNFSLKWYNGIIGSIPCSCIECMFIYVWWVYFFEIIFYLWLLTLGFGLDVLHHICQKISWNWQKLWAIQFGSFPNLIYIPIDGFGKHFKCHWNENPRLGNGWKENRN